MMELTMSDKELDRAIVLRQVLDGLLTKVKAAKLLILIKLIKDLVYLIIAPK